MESPSSLEMNIYLISFLQGVEGQAIEVKIPRVKVSRVVMALGLLVSGLKMTMRMHLMRIWRIHPIKMRMHPTRVRTMSMGAVSMGPGSLTIRGPDDIEGIFSSRLNIELSTSKWLRFDEKSGGDPSGGSSTIPSMDRLDSDGLVLESRGRYGKSDQSLLLAGKTNPAILVRGNLVALILNDDGQLLLNENDEELELGEDRKRRRGLDLVEAHNLGPDDATQKYMDLDESSGPVNVVESSGSKVDQSLSFFSGGSWFSGLPTVMNVLSWNSRRLGQPRTVSMLRELSQTHKVCVIFLFETLAHSNKIEEIRVLLGFDGSLAVNCIGRGGGLAVLWRNMDDLKDSSNPLRTLHSASNLLWCCIGDINDLLSPNEKKGEVDHPPYLFRGFREAVVDYDLHDLLLKRYPFTWVRSKGKPNAMEEKLDRAFVTTSWLVTFDQARLRNLLAPMSAHSQFSWRLNRAVMLELVEDFVLKTIGLRIQILIMWYFLAGRILAICLYMIDWSWLRRAFHLGENGMLYILEMLRSVSRK
ncbi:hypothetical protein PTKIN_Ptkin17bG0025300 [Pterospermum kingtungense]